MSKQRVRKCSECGFSKVPAGTKGNVCPDCLARKALDEAYAAVRAKFDKQ